MKLAQVLLLALLTGLLACCGGRPATEETSSMPTLKSSAFADGGRMPKKHTADGEDLSPPLDFAEIPAGAKELALICEDPDAPTATPWVHWVLYGIGPATGSLPEGFAAGETPARDGRNSWPGGKNLGWRGPAPPPGSGDHHYIFTLYALDAALDLEPGATVEELRNKMAGHILGSGTVTGLYSR
ncbi:MAG: YbhB/YbcL family Raf kinase inhibitor-like protein [Planctomycetota bacterium]